MLFCSSGTDQSWSRCQLRAPRRSTAGHLREAMRGLLEEDAEMSVTEPCGSQAVGGRLFTVPISARREPWVRQAQRLICNCSVSDNSAKYQRLLLTRRLLPGCDRRRPYVFWLGTIYKLLFLAMLV